MQRRTMSPYLRSSRKFDKAIVVVQKTADDTKLVYDSTHKEVEYQMRLRPTLETTENRGRNNGQVPTEVEWSIQSHWATVQSQLPRQGPSFGEGDTCEETLRAIVSRAQQPKVV